MTTTPIAAALLSMIAAATCGCGSAPSDPSCEAAGSHLGELGLALISDSEVPQVIAACKTEQWSSAMRRCLIKTRRLEDSLRCAEEDEERSRRRGGVRRSEAELKLDAIGKAALAEYARNKSFPHFTVGLTPSTSSCELPGKKYPVVASDWSGVPAWDALGFEMTEPFYFQYSYTGDASTFVAEAVGDLDCDGVSVTYTLRGRILDGQPVVELTKPPRAD